jgi:histidinol-phosphate aminotransferase
MNPALTRRSLLEATCLALGANLLSAAAIATPRADDGGGVIHLNLNENAFGPSPTVAKAIHDELPRVSRYADRASAAAFTEQIAAYERVPAEQIVLGEILGALGLYLGSQGGPGGEFIYSTPGYLALIDAASHVGGVGVPVPLDKEGRNDLPGIADRVNARTRAVYLINPHNPTGTVSEDTAFKDFLREVSRKAPVIVDEAYLEYLPDFETRSASSLVREGANVVVFRTFDKIYGLAGLPIGYSILPRTLGDALRKQGIGDAEGLGRLNIAAASAALVDRPHVQRVRSVVASERERWNSVLDALKLQRTGSRADFVFFDSGRPQHEVTAAFQARHIEIGRAFPPYNTWVRITIGRPEENKRAQESLSEILRVKISPSS